MKTLSQYCSAGFLGLCLSIGLSSCTPGGDDGALKLKAAPTEAQIRSGKLAFTFLNAGRTGRVLLPGWQAERIAGATAPNPLTKITKNSGFCAIGIPVDSTVTPKENIVFTWYNAQFTYYPPRSETSTQNPGGKYDVWMSVRDVLDTPGTAAVLRPVPAEYYFFFGSLWDAGDFSSGDANAGGTGIRTGKYRLETPWQKTN